MGAGISSVPPANGTRGAWPDPRPNENEESEGLFINATDEEDERLDKAAVYRIVGSMHRLRRRRAHDYAEETANMTRFQIMQQAGVAALGQAKAIPQSIISLLS